MANQVVRISPRTAARARRAIWLANRAATIQSAGAVLVGSVASATTINLNYASGEIVTITGTTTIVTISAAGKVNELRRVRFADALTLTHNASTLVLPTGANITTAANDYAEFVSTSTGWFCSLYRLVDGTILGVVPISKGGTSNTTAVAAIDALHTESTDIASAAVVDLSVATGAYVNITGNVTITGFVGMTAGVIRYLTFAGSPILQYDATNLKLPGKADIQCQAGDRITMISLGS